MATIGCARVSTRDQNPDDQTDALEAAGCDKIFVEHASGTLVKRPVLTEALGHLREGDSLVVTKLDRLGRSETSSRLQMNCSNVGRVEGLVAAHRCHHSGWPLFFHALGAIAEFEHYLIHGM